MSKFHSKPIPRLEKISLTTNNKERLISFYTQTLGMTLHKNQESVATLGTKDSVLLELVEDLNASFQKNSTSLYHIAYLYPDRRYLSRILKHFIETKTPIQGASDHVISEAIYLSDPDGNGIELAADTDEQKWPWKHNQLDIMANQSALDIDEILSLHTENLSLFPVETILGHAHFHGSDLSKSKEFYQNVLGMDLIINIPSAGFFSWGKYHHHLAVNLWKGQNIPLVKDNSVGLRYLQFNVEQDMYRRLQPFSISDHDVILKDPSNFTLKFTQYK